jgi:hypothetical protein
LLYARSGCGGWGGRQQGLRRRHAQDSHLRRTPLLPLPPQERAWQSASRAAGAGERSARDTLGRTLAAVDALAAEGTAAALALAARLVASWAEDEDAREAVVAVGARAPARSCARCRAPAHTVAPTASRRRA